MRPDRAHTARLGEEIPTYLLLCAGTLFAVVPILWGLSTSLKLPEEISAYPPTWWPAAPTLDNYAEVIFDTRFLSYLWNTCIVVLTTMVLSLGLAVHAAYAVVRQKFFAKRTLLFAMWATIMIPGISIVVPLYMMAVDAKIYDTLFVLVLVYSAWLVPTLVWLLRGFIASIPEELEHAALIDGCTPVTAFYRIVLPLLKPGLVAGAVLVFVMIWNEFLIGYSLVQSDEHRLIQVGVYYFVNETGIDWGRLTAAAIASLIPIFVAYGVLQRAFVQGLTGGAIKG
jgi:multiple sugar transport system permease protein